ncbi:hypothetical protein EHS25_009841 [Saitozyma podzolica]|uniref:Transcription initiation factor IIF subunit beta n=1 Tax=Saitozyma podzolica TaxID=1890683 RepID=A0A427YKC4_9TREE|nr:hypothetical protein EHS25_009841 [Saitozyma podzolica]
MVWAVKVPRFLLERWERVPEAGIELGTLVVDNSVVPAKVTLRLPDTSVLHLENGAAKKDEHDEEQEPLHEAGPSRRHVPLKYDTTGIPDEYEVNVPVERARNTWVFSERVRTWAEMGGGSNRAAQATGKRKREKANPKLVGAVQHECTVRPINSAKYRKILEQRRLESEHSRRPVQMLDEATMSRGRLNQMASGYANAASGFGRGLVSRKATVAAGEKYARLERNELIDRLFALFAEKPYWGISALRTTLQQPDAYLREVLPEVAEMIQQGPYKNCWTLKDTWRPSAGGEGREGVQTANEDDGKLEQGDDEDMEGSDEEEDFEEVLE